MPYSRRTGKRYAAGSTTTRGGWEPKRCVYGDRCPRGGKIVISDQHALWFFFDDITGKHWSAHAECVRERGWPA